MGSSSKKHKERDRDEKRHKHKRDKDKERGHDDEKDRRERKEKKRHKHRHKRSSRSPSPSESKAGESDKRDRHERRKRRKHDRHERGRHGSSSSSVSGAGGGDPGPDRGGIGGGRGVEESFLDEVFQLVKEAEIGDGEITKGTAVDTGKSVKVPVEKDPVHVSESSGGGYAGSLSIAETNKIRAKLGLPPLTVDDGTSQPKAEGGDKVKKDKEDVHKPAANLADKKRAEEMKAKLALIKEKRKINQKLHKVKKLADGDDDLDDVTAWVERSRKNQLERDLAAKTAQMLEEMDEEFGIAALVENEFAPRKEEAYSFKDIRHLKVLHSAGSFKEGKNVILTLKDGDVLGEDEDELMNVNFLDDEKAAKNVELRKKKKDYRPYEDDTIDEYGMMKPRDVLTKYNEEIEGAKVQSFRLSESESRFEDEEQRLARIRANLQAQAVSLDIKAPTLASEYYTSAEMESFKKPKKKRVRKIKKKFTVDDLTPDDDHVASSDHGSRGRPRQAMGDSIRNRREGYSLEGQEGQQQSMDMDVDLPDIDQGGIVGPDNEDELYQGPPIEDEAEQELQMVLSKARKLKLKKNKIKSTVEEKIAEEVSKIKPEPMESESTAPPLNSPLIGSTGASKGLNITLNSTSEFCRTLGEIPTYGLAGNREDDEDDLIDFEHDAQEMEHGGEETAQEGWNAVNLNLDQEEEQEYPVDTAGPVLEEEPTVQIGVAGALNLAMKKGYIEQEFIKSTLKSKNMEDLESKNFTVEDKNYNDIDAKYSKHDRYRGPLADFKEKDGYKPDVQLRYVDDGGREINQKEAFRLLSHRFHGKGSGKMKTDKRAKKQMEIESMKKMSSTDTPLNTVAMMKQKQKQTQSPFILLSGGSKSLTANTLAK